MSHSEGVPKTVTGYELPGAGDKDGKLPDEYAKTEPIESLHAFLSKIDILVNALPSSPTTRQVLGREEFKAMKNSALVVNVRPFFYRTHWDPDR